MDAHTPLKRLIGSATPGAWGDDAVGDDSDMVCIRVADFARGAFVARAGEEPTRRQIDPATARRLALAYGDILLERSGDTGYPARYVGETGVIYSNFLLRIRAKPEVDARYLWYVLQWAYLSGIAAGCTNRTTMSNLDVDAYMGQRVPLWPVATQCTIADYLDHETARIDALISAKHRTAELLDEALTSRIEMSLCHPTVSKTPLRRLLIGPPQYGASESGDVNRLDWPRYIRITDLAPDGTLREADKRTLPPAVARPYLLRDWDILIARSGATVGKAFAYRRSMGLCCFAGYLIRFRFDERKFLPGLVELWTRTRHYWSQIDETVLQATIENVSAEKYKDLIVPVPPPVNQQQILTTLRSYRGQTERLQSLLHKQIDLLTEHRQALITAAVTGQLDIPAAA